MVITQGGIDFKVPDGIGQTTLKLILNTDSMDNVEKQYWLELWPSMTREQRGRLNQILQEERDKLDALEVNYQATINKLNKRHEEDILSLI